VAEASNSRSEGADRQTALVGRSLLQRVDTRECPEPAKADTRALTAPPARAQPARASKLKPVRGCWTGSARRRRRPRVERHRPGGSISPRHGSGRHRCGRRGRRRRSARQHHHTRTNPDAAGELLGVHSRYGLHTRAVTISIYRDTLSEGFSHFVTSIAVPVTSGWSVCRVGFAPTGKRRFFTAHAKSRHRARWSYRGCREFAHAAGPRRAIV
jgi:hypothetical protein